METKKQIRYFSIYGYEREQNYLRKMHQSGWKLTKITGLCVYHFEECTPEDVIYQLDYNWEGISNKEEYVKMFNDCGWEYIQDYVGYSYFRKPASDNNSNEEIFFDDESKLQMMERVFKGRMIPLLIIFFGILLPKLILNIISFHNYAVAILFGTVIILYLVVFAVCAKGYLKCKKKLK